MKSTATDQGYSSSVSTDPQWVTVDLGKVQAIKTVRLFPRTDATGLITGFTGANFPTSFNISTSTDGINWTDFAGVDKYTGQSANDGQAKTFGPNSTTVDARYVRIQALAYGKTAPDEPTSATRLQLAEVQVF